MKQTLAIVGFAAAIFWLSSCGNSGLSGDKQDTVDSARAQNDSMPATDKKASDFLTKAASGGMLEVQAGQMAQQKGINPRVRDFGLMMIRDHSKNNDELKSLAAQQGITLPKELSDDHQKHLSELGKQEGNDFDKAYIDMMISDHKGDIDEYTDAAEKITNPAVKAYAKNTVPVLQMHLDSVKAIKASMK